MSKVFSCFYPDFYEESVYSIPYDKLLKKNIKTLIFDVDNTLMPHYIPSPDSKLIRLINRLKKQGFKICILSNGSKGRVEIFVQHLSVDYIYRAKKPLLSGINRALEITGALPEEACIIGDQLFTDILVGKRKKVYTVLVKPISERDEWFVKWKRIPERFILNSFRKRGNSA